MSDRSPLSLGLADADDMKPNEIAAVRDLRPESVLSLLYPAWPEDKGAAAEVRRLVRDLGHTYLLVRFHADPNPVEYARRHGGAYDWGQLCAARMEQHYGALAAEGVELGVILANEVDADYEGGLSPEEASDFYRQAIDGYTAWRPNDTMHVPAPTGAPDTHRRYLEQYKRDGWVRPRDVIDGHGYDGDLENVIDVLADVFPDNPREITETNDLDNLGWPCDLIALGKVRRVCWFVLDWAHGGPGRLGPPSPDDARAQMSLMRHPDKYAEFKATRDYALPIPSLPPATPEPAAPAEVPWLQNHAETQLWSGPEIDAIGFTRVPPWSWFKQTWPQEGYRIPVRYFGNATSEAGDVWVDAADVGPVDAPTEIPPAEPNFVSPEPPHPPPAEDFPVPSWTPSAADILAAVPDVAEEFTLPPRLLLALCVGESGEGLQSFARWHKWTAEAGNHVMARDKAGLRNILARCAAVPTNDISFGPAHQTWRWSPEFKASASAGMNPDPYDLDLILAFRKKYIEDHGHALRVAAAQLKRHYDAIPDDSEPAWADALCRYNKPAVDPAANPNRPNYVRAIATAKRLMPATAPPSSGIVYEDYRAGAAGRFAVTPKGIILHGSRSGRAGNPKDAEYRGTAGYCVNNPDGLSWHCTVGNGKVAVHLDPREWGWHARAASRQYIGVEIAQATVDEPITDAQVDALADWIATRVLPAWPDLPLHFPTHADVERSGETGARDGKSDVYPDVARSDELRGRILARLQGETPVPVAPPEPVAPPVDLANLVGNAYGEEGVVIAALTGAVVGDDVDVMRAQIEAVVNWLRANRPGT